MRGKLQWDDSDAAWAHARAEDEPVVGAIGVVNVVVPVADGVPENFANTTSVSPAVVRSVGIVYDLSSEVARVE